MANLKKAKVRRRTPGGVRKGSTEMRAKRKVHDSKKPQRAIPKDRPAVTKTASRAPVAGRTASARAAKTEKSASDRARSYSSGIKRGGQSGGKTRERATPGVGQKGRTVTNDPS